MKEFKALSIGDHAPEMGTYSFSSKSFISAVSWAEGEKELCQQANVV
ncbi:hypothetical protein ACFOQM_02210 [Paenibacillus sp. GCM10012307]